MLLLTITITTNRQVIRLLTPCLIVEIIVSLIHLYY